jgi:uncharacterized protein (TIGR03066 family)
MRLTSACLLGSLLAALPAASAPIPKDGPKTNAEKLIGTWQIVKVADKAPEGGKFFVEFAKDGKMTLRIELDDKESEPTVLKGKYKVDVDKIDYEMEQPGGGKKQEVLTIKKLTDDELVTVDPDDVKEEFKRVKEKEKKDDK